MVRALSGPAAQGMTQDGPQAPGNQYSALSVNHYLWPEGAPLEPFLDQAARAGAAGVGLTRSALQVSSVPRLRRMLADRSLGVSSLNSAGFFVGEKSAQGMNQALVEAAAELNAHALCIITGGSGDECDLASLRARIAEGLADLNEVAATASVTLGLEPIHPHEMTQKGCINTLAQACDTIAGLSSTRLIVDLYHSWWDPDLHDVLAQGSRLVSVVQACNVIEPAEDRRPYRDLPSAGPVDVGAALSAAFAGAYDGWIELELFERDLRGRSPEAVIAAGVDQLATAVDAASR